MSTNFTRRDFLQGAAAAGSVVAIAGCSTSTEEASEDAADEQDASTESESATGLHDASEYPLDPDGDDVEALWVSETTSDDWIKVTNDDGTVLGYSPDSGKSIIQVDGYAFKDLDGDGKLSLWEDWRQSDEDRAADLASQMSAEEILPLLYHGMLSSFSNDLDDDIVADLEAGLRGGNSSGNITDLNVATGTKFSNKLQAEAEKSSAYGIPFLMSTDPYACMNMPSKAGLAATFDPEVAKEEAKALSKVWRATGPRMMLGPQIGLGTNPRAARLEGVFTVDPALDRDMARAFIDGLQSTYDEDGNDLGWGSDSVAGMMKHYCGIGPTEGGGDDHGDVGKFCVFPGNNFAAHLIPFFDGAQHLDGATGTVAACMPQYGISFSDDEEYGENVGCAFSSYKLGLLRDNGFDGLICTDWQVTLPVEFPPGMVTHCWGVEDLEPVERQVKAYEAGIDLLGGEFDLDVIAETYAQLEADLGEDAALEKIRDTARRLFTVMNHVDFFDNPYIPYDEAKAATLDEEVLALGLEIQQKTVVMLKNKGVIGDGLNADKPTVYIPLRYSDGSWDLPVDADVAAEYFDVVTDTLGDPTGETDDDGNAAYTSDDVVRATAEELSSCSLAICFVQNPLGGGGTETDDDGNVTYLPRSLQYGDYTADGPNVREVSLAGDIVDGEKENRSYFGQSCTTSNSTDLDLILSAVENMPADGKVVVSVGMTNPMIFSEFEDQVDAILVHFESSNWSWDEETILKAVAGQFEPSGLLPFQMPADMDTVEGADEDVPRNLECHVDSEGNEYDFGFGLNWSGVISDERTEKYCVDPISQPETISI